MSKISDFLLPIVIPRRHKGALEVTSAWEMSSKDVKSPLTLLGFTHGCARMTCSLSTLTDKFQHKVTELGVPDINLRVAFDYHLDRSSPQFETSSYQALCGYTFKGGDVSTSSMFVHLPILVKDVAVKAALLKFYVTNPTIEYFEDIVDYLQKYAGIRIYPITSAADREALPGVIDNGKTVEEYMRILTRLDIVKNLGNTGKLSISMPEVYNNYKIKYTSKWAV